MKNHQRIIIVLGVRRTGTSALTKGLETMGVSIVDQTRTPFTSFNTKGFWEDLDMHDFNLKLIGALEPLEHRWRSILPLSEQEADFLCENGFLQQGADLLFSRLSVLSQPLGLKDPRFSILLPFWKRVFQTYNLAVSFVISIRHPFSAIGSMKALATICEPINDHYAKFLWVWLSFYGGCFESTAGAERIVVDYNELLTQPAFQMKRIAHAFNLEIQEDCLKQYSSDFIDPSLCHFKENKNLSSQSPDTEHSCIEPLVVPSSVDHELSHCAPAPPFSSLASASWQEGSACSNNTLTHAQELALEIYEYLFLAAQDQASVGQPQPFLKKWKTSLAAVEDLLRMAEKNEQTILLLHAVLSQYRRELERITKQ